jgi:metallo-beta-lactamase family protein
MVTTLTFLGAAGTVTGSKFLLEHEGRKTLVDCGLYQGERTWRRLNWQPLPVSANLISDVVLTHAHLDHRGHLPALVREGFTGPTWCTQGTAALAAIVLRDSAYLQEEDAENARLGGFSRHDPPRPLYNAADAEKAITSFRALNYHQHCALHSGAHLSFSRAGHILGSACALITIGASTVLFSGDLVEPATRCSSPGRHRLAPAPSSSSRPTATGLTQSMPSPTTRSWLRPFAAQ